MLTLLFHCLLLYSVEVSARGKLFKDRTISPRNNAPDTTGYLKRPVITIIYLSFTTLKVSSIKTKMVLNVLISSKFFGKQFSLR